MAEKKSVLKIYCLSQPLLTTVWRTILGDKYCHALPFDYALTEDINEAQIIAWDGVITIKLRPYMEQIKAQFAQGKVLILMGEAQTLFQDHPFVELFHSKEVNMVQLTGWSVLPEEILATLENCYQMGVRNV